MALTAVIIIDHQGGWQGQGGGRGGCIPGNIILATELLNPWPIVGVDWVILCQKYETVCQ